MSNPLSQGKGKDIQETGILVDTGNDREKAWSDLKKNLEQLTDAKSVHGNEKLLVSNVLHFSNLAFLLGKGLQESYKFLKTAQKVAKDSGDQRSEALIKLHIGRYYYFSKDRHASLSFLADGKSIIESLGDEDILAQSAEFIGFYYHIQGRYYEARPFFERAARIYESADARLVCNPTGPLWLSFCTSYLGDFDLAIGTLDYYRRLALGRSDQSMAAYIRAVLGYVLLMIRRKKEAVFHLSGAQREAQKANNSMALRSSGAFLAYYHFLEGRLRESRDVLQEAFEYGKQTGIITHYGTPFVLELLFEYHRSRIDPISIFPYRKEIEKQISGPNIHLRGVALRLKAMEEALAKSDTSQIEAHLAESERCLIQSGDRIQLAKTRLEFARLKVIQKDKINAKFYAQKAWKNLSGYQDEYYPDDLKPLLNVGNQIGERWSQDDFFERFMNMIKNLMPSAQLDDLLNRVVSATNRFFGAERGGLFWFDKENPHLRPELRAARNLTEKETLGESFKPQLALVLKAHRTTEPQVVKLNTVNRWPQNIKAILCLPIEVGGETRGVLYHDNSYLNSGFDFLKKHQLVQFADCLTAYITQTERYSRHTEYLTKDKITASERADENEIVTNSQIMKKLLNQTDRIAASDSTVLLLGETGVGKELFANRLHRMSKRRDGPMVVVDPTTLPENLFESELFGHERGSFTGADRRKIGRIELAHRGTLFIDEVGEIPKAIQVKLLRAIQEKTLVRIGGYKEIKSDFRLIAATNRNLVEDVAAGLFREDLYFRLNVLPINIPPLRERIEDIPLLARHFMQRYALKHHQPSPKLRPLDESRLKGYHWPGNVRELQNIIERTVLLSDGISLDIMLPTEKLPLEDQFFTDHPSLDELQRRYIQYTLELTGGKISGPGGAAEMLEMKRQTLQKRMKKLGLT